MKFIISDHALESSIERGASSEEIAIVLEQGFNLEAKQAGWIKRKLSFMENKEMETFILKKR